MGSSPKTKAEYADKIAREISELARLQNAVLTMKRAGNKEGALNWQQAVNNQKAKIARLKLEMKNAPKG